MKAGFVLFVCLLFIVGCVEPNMTNRNDVNSMEKIMVTSSAFAQGKPIPVKYTCNGANVNPPMYWTPVPGAAAYALIIDDPDAPLGTWTHWMLVNIPSTVTSIRENSSAGNEIQNSAGVTKYSGPCPPSGTHRYFFKVFALKDKVDKNALTVKNAESELQKNAVAYGELMGTVSR